MKNSLTLFIAIVILGYSPGHSAHADYDEAYARAQSAMKDRDYTAAAKAFKEAAAAEGVVRQQMYYARFQEATSYAHATEFDIAIKLLNALIEDMSKDPIYKTDSVLLQAMTAYPSYLRSTDGVEASKKEFEKLHKNKELFTKFYNPGTTRSRLLYIYGVGSAMNGDPRRAMDLLLESLIELPVNASTTVAKFLVTYFPGAEAQGPSMLDDESFQARVLDAMLINADRPEIVASIFQLRTMMAAAAGEFDAALYRAKLLITISTSSKQLEDGIQQLSMMLKAKDGNLSRVNRFLEYQKFGKAGPDKKPGTDDDLSDPIADIVSPSDPVRDKKFHEYVENLPTDWQGLMRRAMVYRIWNRPKEALAALNHAYRICPYEQKALQTVTDQLVTVLVHVTGDPKAGDKFVAYQQYGPAGPDGKMKTPDDLTDILGQFK